MNLLYSSSPNFDRRPLGTQITALVLHHTNMASAAEALARLCNPESKVSCHYLITIAGEIYQLVADCHRAWHAGLSSWRGQDKVNDYSIGIELDNPGDAPFPTPQISALVSLCQKLLNDHPHLEARNIVSHADIAPARKDDPNHFFPWQYLASQGIGLFPTYNATNQKPIWQLHDRHPKIKSIQKKLAAYGYHLNIHGEYDLLMEQTVTAFNRHFNPAAFTYCTEKTWSTASEAALAALVALQARY